MVCKFFGLVFSRFVSMAYKLERSINFFAHGPDAPARAMKVFD